MAEIHKKRKLTGIQKRNMKKNLVAYAFIAPNFIGFTVFTLFPMLFAIVLAFIEWDGNNPVVFVGIQNFVRLFQDTMFLRALRNTLIYCVGTVPLTLAMSLFLAIILNQKVAGKGFFRTLAFFPYVASLVAVTAVWSMIFHPTKGPVNHILYSVFHVAGDRLPNWFGGDLILVMFILFSVWKYMGYYMVIYLAGLQGISAELYEAANLDGANTWQKFLYITLPQLRKTSFFVSIMITISCFKIYDIAIMLAGGGDGKLGSSSMVLVYYIYQNAFEYWKLGYSSAIAMVLFLLVLAITLFQFRIQAKYEKE